MRQYIIFRFERYAEQNTQNYDLWNSMNIDLNVFIEQHWDMLDSDTWTIVLKYFYSREFWLDHSENKNKRVVTMTKAMNDDYYENWTLNQIR
jgi:hypothetical protein